MKPMTIRVSYASSRPQQRDLRTSAATVLIAAVLYAGVCLLPQRASAEVHIYLRENGKRVYVNADENAFAPAARKRGAGPATALSIAASRRLINTPGGPAVVVASRTEIEHLIEQTAERHKVDPALIRAVIAQESGYHSGATSRKGAQGLMQLMPGTARDLGVNNAYDAGQNIDGGVRYLRALLEKYHGDLDRALAAYNAGEGAVQRANGVPNFAETRNYVRRVTDNYFRGSAGRQPFTFSSRHPIRREADGRGGLLFTNE
jgi:soluble lytic murein transglycosylase-like protein